MAIIIINSQKKIKLDSNKIRAAAKKVLKILNLPKDTLVAISFIGRNRIKRLNKKYFGRDKTTDVIALGYKKGAQEVYLGDILICPVVCVENAKKYNNTFFQELKLYITHGILHLTGYKDTSVKEKARMQRKEQEILKKL